MLYLGLFISNEKVDWWLGPYSEMRKVPFDCLIKLSVGMYKQTSRE